MSQKINHSKRNVAVTNAIFREWKYSKSAAIHKPSGLSDEDKARMTKKCSPNFTRFFFVTKFQSTCHICHSTVPVGVKAMIRPAAKDLPKLFCCYDCSTPWRGDVPTPTNNYPDLPKAKSQHDIDVENRVTLNTSGERDEIYKILDQIYEQE